MTARARARRRARAALVTLGAALALAGAPAPAAAEIPDYGSHPQWNGLSQLDGLASAMGLSVSAVSTLEWGDLTADDILFFLYPIQRVDPARLGAFLSAGGNVVIADDFGEGKDAMQSLGLLRAENVAAEGIRYEANQPWAPVAASTGDHPIAREVGEVVTNHPAVLTHVEGASVVAGFKNGAVVVAGERGSGRFVAVSDPSIFINQMLTAFPGNVILATNILKWLNRGGRARNIVLVRGDVQMYGEPRPFIDDARAGQLGRSIADLNFWLSERRAWLLTPGAMKALAIALAIALLLLAVVALPVRRGPKIDGAWLRFGRPTRRDEPATLIGEADRSGGGSLVVACILRDHVQLQLAIITRRLEPLYTVPESLLVGEIAAARGSAAGVAMSRVYRRLKALPSRSQAAAPWSAGHLPRRDFDALYRDVAELCRTLGSPLPDDQALLAMPSPVSASVSRAPQTRPPA
ncbi:MAG TPA: DUF4350 domain-containing protein [Kofleriaceae bacterium]|nr:DUF4350 domain-containing protein [Kofleriaceae bacterium]